MPGSGKTTWARERVEGSNGTLKLVSKDSIREMLDNGRGFPDDWETVEFVRDLIAEKLLARGFDVVFDETHLPDGQMQRTEKTYWPIANIQYVVFDAPFYTCVERLRNRYNPRQVPSPQEMNEYWNRMQEVRHVLAWRSRNEGVAVAYGTRSSNSEGSVTVREGDGSGRDHPDAESSWSYEAFFGQ